MDNSYTITSIDPSINAVYLTLTIDGVDRNHTVFVKDVNDADIITKACSDGFSQVKAEVTKNTAQPDLPKDVEALIDKPVEV